LERNNIKLLEWFRILAQLADGIALANKLKNITAVLPAKVLQVKEIFMRLWILLQFGNCLLCL
jgi:hypothetical protein